MVAERFEAMSAKKNPVKGTGEHQTKKDGEPKKKRASIRTSISAFKDAAKRLNMSERDLCEAVGYTRSGYSHWEETGTVPKSAYLAAEGLVRRAGPGAANQTWVLLHFIDGKLNDSRDMGVEPPRAQFNGQDYFLIPVVK